MIESSKDLVTKINFQLGVCALTKEQYANAAQLFSDSLKSMLQGTSNKQEADWEQLGKLCLNVAKCLKNLSAEEIAKEYARKAIDASIKVKDTETSTAATTLLSALQTAQTAAKTTQVAQKADNDDDEFEDWDEELNLDTNQRQTLSLEGSNKPTVPVVSVIDKKEVKKELIPLRYKIMENSRKNEIEIVK